MRIHVLSDLHADFTGGSITLPDVDCDVHLVLGDGAAPMTTALPIVREAIKDSAPVIYVPGNHDYYISAKDPGTFYQDQVGRGRHLAHQLGITLGHNDVVAIGNTRILCTTLWTNMGARPEWISRKMAMQQSQRGWFDDGSRNRYDRDYHNDFRQIRYGAPGSKNRFTPSQFLALHEEAMAFLRTELAKDWDGETVIASHMAPSVQSLTPGNHAHDWLYATTDVDFFDRVDLWCHGHIHAGRDYEIDGCRVLANPRGYPMRDGSFENVSWDPAMVVEVERRYAPTFGM